MPSTTYPGDTAMSTEYEPPKPIGAAKGDICKFAEHIANILGCSPGGDLEPIVKHLRGKITYLPLDATSLKAASITVEKGGEFVIQLFKNVFPLQERLSIAHELGHLFLHSRLGEVAIKAFHGIGEEDEAAESEAHQFAYAFLMPAEAVKKAVDTFGPDSLAIAAEFMVPGPVAYRRIKDVYA
jgi:hypothetical protein